MYIKIMTQNGSKVRNDTALINAFTDLASEGIANPASPFGGRARLTKTVLEELYRIPILRRVCRAMPESAALKGWEITLGEKADPRTISGYNKYQDKLRLPESFVRAQVEANIYGGAAIVVVVDDGVHWSKPIQEKRIRSIKGLKILDGYKIRPDLNSFADPLNPEYYQIALPPQEIEALQVNPQKQTNRIHHSRVIRFDGVINPPDLMLRDGGWGGSLLECLYEDFWDWKNGLKAVTSMLNDFSLFIYKMSHLGEMIADNDEDLIKTRFRTLRMGIKSMGGAAIDAENEEISFVTRQFGGIDAVADRLRDAFIGSTGLPHTKLFGESPSGLGATGESEKKDWAQDVEAFQQSQWMFKLRQLGRLVFLSQDGPTKAEEPEDWGYKFIPLLQQSEQEIIANRSSQAQVDNTYITAGVLLPEEVRQSRFGGSEYSHETLLDEKAWKESKQQQEFGGFEGGEEDLGGEPPVEEDGIEPEDIDGGEDADLLEAVEAETEKPIAQKDSLVEDSIPVKRVVNWNGIQVGVTHVPGDTRFPNTNPMESAYGYIRGTKGKPPTVYLGMNLEQTQAYKVRQVDPETGLVDEDKYFIGFPDIQQVRKSFIAHAGQDRFGGIEPVNESVFLPYRIDAAHFDACDCPECNIRRKKRKKRSPKKKPTDRLDTKKEDPFPNKARPGHTWVDDKRVRGGGYWRKLPKSKKGAIAATIVGAAAVGTAALISSRSKGKTESTTPVITQNVQQSNNLRNVTIGASVAGGIGAGAAIAYSRNNQQQKSKTEIKEELGNTPIGVGKYQVVVQSAGWTPEHDYTWTENPNGKKFTPDEIDLLESESPSLLLTRKGNNYHILITGQSSNRVDYRSRRTRNSLSLTIPVGEDKLARGIASATLRGDFAEGLNSHVTDDPKSAAGSQQGFFVSYSGLEKYISSFSAKGDSPPNPRSQLIKSKTSEKRKEDNSALADEIENHRFPDTDGVLIASTGITKKSKYEKLKVWRGVANFVDVKTDSIDEDKDTPEVVTEQGLAEAERITSSWVKEIKQWMQQFDSYEEMSNRLPELYDQLQGDEFAEAIAQHNLLSHLAGMGDIIDEVKDDA